MAIQENKDLIHRFVEEIYNQKNLDNYSDFVGEEILEQGIDHMQQFFTAFPDSQTTVLDIFGEGEKVVARLLVQGTNKGTFAGQPPTGKKVEFVSIRIYRVGENKIIESWAMQDQLGLMQQLGFVRTVGDVNWATEVEED
jgi:predicted ester cyclase